MDATIAFSLVKLVQAGLNGERDAVGDYARQISDQLKAMGDDDAAKRVRAAVNGRPATKASVTRLNRPMPVDTESRLSVADEVVVDSPPEIFLAEEPGRVVDRFLSCLQNADELTSRGVEVPASLLLHGPPGCGKTLLAYSISHRLGLPLVVARSDSLISSYLGSTAKNVRSLFDYASSKKCILFLDEFDALAKMRDDQHELGELKRVVISLLQNIDATCSNYVLLAATNHSHLLDPAVWRRFKYTVKIDPPGQAARSAMLQSFWNGMASSEIIQTVSMISEGLTGAQLRDIADDAVRDAVLNERTCVDLCVALQMAAERIGGCSTTSVPDTIRLLRDKLGKSISQARLGKLFGVSQPQVSRILKSEGSNG